MLRFVLTFLILPALPLAAAADVLPAVEVVAPYLVRIETIGGHERIGRAPIELSAANEGTSTGILLDREGYIMTAAFNFLHDPASILLVFSDGSKKVAHKIAADRLRMLTLLKAHDFTAEEISPIPFRNKKSFRIGERCIAAGIVFSDEPNVALGIISGIDRIWGKAIQTDTAVGPNNYGGLLIDLQGNALGIPVPLSMSSHEITAGAELYDGGVGMAIPWEDMLAILPKLKEGNDLMPGSFGFVFRDNQTFIGEPSLSGVQPGSAAAKAEMRPGDKIVRIDGIPMPTALAVTKYIKQRYAGETLDVAFLRNEVEHSVSLTAQEEQ